MGGEPGLTNNRSDPHSWQHRIMKLTSFANEVQTGQIEENMAYVINYNELEYVLRTLSLLLRSRKLSAFIKIIAFEERLLAKGFSDHSEKALRRPWLEEVQS